MNDICLILYVNGKLKSLENDNLGFDGICKTLESSYIALEKLSKNKRNEIFLKELYKLYNRVAIKYLPACDTDSISSSQAMIHNSGLDSIF